MQPKDLYFALDSSPDGGFMVLVPVSHWDAERTLLDDELVVEGLPAYLGEPEMEATWSLPEGTPSQDVHADMIAAGFIHNPEMLSEPV
jgi:hypothetical protein